MKYSVVVKKGLYSYDASCIDLPGCHSHGETHTEALKNIRDAIAAHLEMSVESQVYEIEVVN